MRVQAARLQRRGEEMGIHEGFRGKVERRDGEDESAGSVVRSRQR